VSAVPEQRADDEPESTPKRSDRTFAEQVAQAALYSKQNKCGYRQHQDVDSRSR
jgi:hypothetical protein